MLATAILNASSAGTPAKRRSAEGRVLGQSHSMLRESLANMMRVDAHVMPQLDGHALDVLQLKETCRRNVIAGPLLERLDVSRRLGQWRWRRTVVGLLIQNAPASRDSRRRCAARQPVEHAGHDELGEADGGPGCQERQRDPLHDLRRPQLLEDLGVGARYSKVGCAARGPSRSKATCTVSGIFMSTAAAQNRSSSAADTPCRWETPPR